MEGIENINPRDISEQFRDMSVIEFLEFLHTLRNEPILIINADFSDISDKYAFQTKAQRLKAFLESANRGQKRNASIRCRKEQVMWEPNVFNSGVKKDLVD